MAVKSRVSVGGADLSDPRRRVQHVLPSARRRQQETAAREAAGESLWTTDFEERALVRLRAVWHLFEEQYGIGSTVASILKHQGGWDYGQYVAPRDLAYDQNPDTRLDMIAAVAAALKQKVGGQAEKFTTVANIILNEHRIAHKFVEGELVSFESDELLQEVVEPTLRLLVGEQFKAAHDAYLKALREISANDPGDAITDAATALQQTLVALGCDGNALGPLMKDAKKKGLLGSHDQPLIDGIGKFIDWVNSDRTATGDAHDHSDAVLADAWLVVHVVGALIVRLADPTPRGSAG